MACNLCTEFYDTEDHRPKQLPCGHTTCATCLVKLEQGGGVKCSVDNITHPFKDFTDFADNLQILEEIKASVVLCPTHRVAFTHFCKQDFQAFCPRCEQHTNAKCELIDIQGNEDELKFFLTTTIETRYTSVPKEIISQFIQTSYDNRFRLRWDKLVIILKAITDTFSSPNSAMQCMKCTTRFDFGEHRPKSLPCGHTLCKNCLTKCMVEKIAVCPFDGKKHDFSNSEIPDNYFIKEKLEETTIFCPQHRETAIGFCKEHCKGYCASCPQHTDTECEVVTIQGNEGELKFFLNKKIENIYNSTPTSSIPGTVRVKYNQRFKLKMQELVSLLNSFSLTAFSGMCVDCEGDKCKYIDIQSVATYCQTCYEKHNQKESDARYNFVEFSGNEEDVKRAVLDGLFDRLKRIDFYYLTPECYHFISDFASLPIFLFMQIAKTFANLEHKPKLKCSEFPDMFQCPQCRVMLDKRQCAFWKLPCKFAYHALCTNCYSSSIQGLVQCPLDHNQFFNTGSGTTLEYIEIVLPTPETPTVDEPKILLDEIKEDPIRTNWITSSTPVVPAVVPAEQQRIIIGETHVLAEIGYPMPVFAPRADLPLHIPRDNLTCLNKYLKIVPPPASTIVPQSSESSFLEPWYINKYENQVEALTFASWRDTNLWGVGITNPIENGAVGIIEYIRIYAGDSAEGTSHFDCELLQKELIGGTDLMTDVYFKKPCPLQSFSCVTMKIRLTFQPTTDPPDPLPIYHGHHIGRFEDLEGADETRFEVMRTVCVDENERTSGQLEIIGPIVRLIYEK